MKVQEFMSRQVETTRHLQGRIKRRSNAISMLDKRLSGLKMAIGLAKLGLFPETPPEAYKEKQGLEGAINAMAKDQKVDKQVFKMLSRYTALGTPLL